MTPDNAIWWLKLKAKQKQKKVAPIFQGGTLPVTDITAEPIGKGKYLAEFDKQNPRQPYQETNEYIRRFQPEKVVQKQAWRDVERNRLRDNYAESYMIRDRDLKMQQEYEKNKDSLPWWKKRVEGVNTTSQQKEQILEQQAKGRLEWSNKPLEHKAGWIANETAMALVPELFFLKGTGKGAQIAKNISNTVSDTPASSIINKTDKVIDATKAGGKVLNKAGKNLIKPEVGKSATSLIKKGVESAKKSLNNSVQNAYKINPWAFKPNPEAYYRVGDGKEFIDDVLRTNKIRVYNKNSYANLREAGKISGIREDGKIVLKAKTFPEVDTYWSKGVPLDGRFSSQKYGDYMIEASNDIPFIQAVNQKTKQRGFWDAPDVNYNSTHAKSSYVKPRQSYGYDVEGNIKPSIGTPLEYNPEFIKLYRPHWLKGYKEIKTGKADDVVRLVERKQVFDKETLDAIDRYNKYFGKNDPNSTLTMADKVKIGRDVVSRNNLEKAYRNTHIEEILDARKKGYFNNEKFPDTDWYYGGSSSRYGNIEIEAIPDSKFFRLFEVDGKYAGIITRYKDVLHLKGNNVPYKGTIIRYKGKELSDDMLERISKIYKKGDNLDEIISSITK